MALDLPLRKCLCGCGKKFKPKRRGQRFYNRQCRFRYHNRKAVPEKTWKEEAEEIITELANFSPCGVSGMLPLSKMTHRARVFLGIEKRVD